MPETRFLKCACAHCGGRIEFPADGIGAKIPCPHCGVETELTLEVPENVSAESPARRKWIVVAGVILVLGIVGVVGAFVAANVLLKKSRNRSGANDSVANVSKSEGANRSAGSNRSGTVINDFTVSAVTLERKPGSTLLYATGRVRNESDKQRFGVTVEIDLLDSDGARIGTTRDYKDMVEAGAEWNFRALLVAKNVASARVTAVREQ